MSSDGIAVISVVVLQNSMDLVNGETSVTSDLDGNKLTGIEAERVSCVTEELNQEPATIPVIKKEPNVSCVLW
jgi:hypothetical protein